MTDVFIGRQPVLDANQAIWGYELLFRSSTENRATFDCAQVATSQVILNALLEFGLDRVVGKDFALVNMPRDFLVGDHCDLLPPSRVILEVLDNIEIDDEIVAGVRRLHDAGYTIALDDFAFEDRWAPLLELAHIIKVEVPAISPEQRSRLGKRIASLKASGTRMLAEKVETREEFEAYRDLGFDYFQGYFFSKPDLMQSTRIPGNRMQALKLVAQLNQPDVEFGALEQTVSSNVDLSYKIMRLLNSARYGLNRRVDSVREALVLVGLRQLRALATMVSLAGIDDKPTELLVLSLMRARMCDRLAEMHQGQGVDTAFTVGMLSTLDALLDRPLEELLAELPLTQDVSDAILKKGGTVGRYLDCAIGCERTDLDMFESFDVTPDEIANLYVECMEWARETLDELAA